MRKVGGRNWTVKTPGVLGGVERTARRVQPHWAGNETCRRVRRCFRSLACSRGVLSGADAPRHTLTEELSNLSSESCGLFDRQGISPRHKVLEVPGSSRPYRADIPGIALLIACVF